MHGIGLALVPMARKRAFRDYELLRTFHSSFFFLFFLQIFRFFHPSICPFYLRLACMQFCIRFALLPSELISFSPLPSPLSLDTSLCVSPSVCMLISQRVRVCNARTGFLFLLARGRWFNSLLTSHSSLHTDPFFLLLHIALTLIGIFCINLH